MEFKKGLTNVGVKKLDYGSLIIGKCWKMNGNMQCTIPGSLPIQSFLRKVQIREIKKEPEKAKKMSGVSRTRNFQDGNWTFKVEKFQQ